MDVIGEGKEYSVRIVAGLLAFTFVVSMYAFLSWHPVDVDGSRTFEFNYSWNGSTSVVETVYTPEYRVGDELSGKGVHTGIILSDGVRHEIEIATEDLSYVNLVGKCQHELRHADFFMEEYNSDVYYSYEEEESMIGFGVRGKWKYLPEVQLLNFKPVCWSQVAELYAESFP